MTAELMRALAVLAEPPRKESAAVAAALELDPPTADAYTAVFVLDVYPYASVYLNADGMLGGESRDRVAGFWRALDLRPPAEPDHAAALLGLLASLTEAAASDARAAHARHALLWEHVLPWMPLFAAKVQDVGVGPYPAWADRLMTLLCHEARRAPAPTPSAVHLRDAHALPRDTPRDLQAVLSPLLSGMVIARSDLARAARTLGLGLRRGERRFMLRSLLDQDAPATTRWIAGEARAWRARHERLRPVLGPSTDFWIDRARATIDAFTHARPSPQEQATGAT